jgi:hypothetical protein
MYNGTLGQLARGPSKIMLDPTQFEDFCRESAFVAKSIEVHVDVKGVDDNRRIHIDALQNPGSTTPYTVSAYIEETIPEETIGDGTHAAPRAWVAYELGHPSCELGRSRSDSSAGVAP